MTDDGVFKTNILLPDFGLLHFSVKSQGTGELASFFTFDMIKKMIGREERYNLA